MKDLTQSNHYKKRALRYAILPGIIPRIVRLFSGTFSFTAYLMASIYNFVGLLPNTHPYLNPVNQGRYGIRHVITEAARNLDFSWKKADQVLVFFTILTGLFLLIFQFVFLLAAVFMHQPAVALSLSYQEIFGVGGTAENPNSPGPAQDIIFITLDRVFGMQGIYNSCVSDAGIACLKLDGTTVIPTPATYPYPIHIALHSLLQFYSMGIFLVSIIIILYYFITIVGETAASGTPFGRRLNRLWAPIRLIVFFALLMPLNIGNDDRSEGINGAQLIVFWAAKLGSSFATNAASRFDQQLTGSYLGETQTLLATPNIPEFHTLMQFLYVARTCKMASETAYNISVPESLRLSTQAPHGGIQAYIVRPKQAVPVLAGDDVLRMDQTDFDTAFRHANYGNITVRFGVLDDTNDKNSSYWANVYPYCGEIKFRSVNMERTGNPITTATDIQELYYNLVRDVWTDTSITPQIQCIVAKKLAEVDDASCATLPTYADLFLFHDFYHQQMITEIESRINLQLQDPTWTEAAGVQPAGWFGLSLMYFRIAQENGKITTSIFNIPLVGDYPIVMNTIAKARTANVANVDTDTIFDPDLPEGASVSYPMFKDKDIVRPMYEAYKLWTTDAAVLSHFEKPSGSTVEDLVDMLFGARGIYDIRSNTDIHPLAQLTVLGKSMMEVTIRNISLGWLGDGAGKILEDLPGDMVKVVGGFFKTIGFATLALSFVLFYVLPFMPFLFFFFAAMDWIKTIFEAIVAMPLWVLSHIRIDGDGLPGPAAVSGYFLIFEIFLRPILIVFGFLIGIIIFSSMVTVLNEIFDQVVANVSGFDMEEAAAGNIDLGLNRTSFDEFAFTVMYVIVVYLIGNSTFKLVDLIPQQILRWMGSGVAAFREFNQNPAEEVQGTTYIGLKLGTQGLRGGALAFID